MSCKSLYYIPLQNGVLWPCKTRFSSRVKRSKLCVTPEGKTELVIPTHCVDAQHIEEMLIRWQPWLNKTCNKLFSLEEQKQLAHKFSHVYTCAFDALDLLPTQIDFPILQEAWRVHYEADPLTHTAILRQHDDFSLHLGGSTQGCCILLQRWLQRKARPVLTEQVRQLACELQLHINKVRIGSQRSRWGSCSSQSNINLNCRLILLPPHLVKHVFYHELCHLTHLNHSAQYRELLASVAPHWKEHEKALDTAWRNLPEWATVL